MADLVSTGMSIEVIFDKIPSLTGELPSICDSGLDKAADIILADAKAEAPVLTGALEASGYKQTPKEDTRQQAMADASSHNPGVGFGEPATLDKHEAIVGFCVEYAVFRHDGTAYMAGDPFLADAAERNAQAVNDAVEHFITAWIEDH